MNDDPFVRLLRCTDTIVPFRATEPGLLAPIVHKAELACEALGFTDGVGTPAAGVTLVETLYQLRNLTGAPGNAEEQGRRSCPKCGAELEYEGADSQGDGLWETSIPAAWVCGLCGHAVTAEEDDYEPFIGEEP